MENTESTPTPENPRTVQELGDRIWNYYQNDSPAGDAIRMLLSDLLNSGKLELAVEVMKLHKLSQIHSEINQIAVDGIKFEPEQLLQALTYLKQ